MGSKFSGSHRRLRKSSYTFIGFHRWTHMYNQKIPGLSSKGVSIPVCYYPTHIFIFIYTTVRHYWTLSHHTEPTQSNTKRNVDYNHALTHIQCNVPVHMQCNVSLHVISCHMHNECYRDNAKTVHFTVYHGQLYQSA